MKSTSDWTGCGVAYTTVDFSSEVIQKMMELTKEQRSVLTDRHVEVSDDYTHLRERTATEMHTSRRQLDEQQHECSQFRSEIQATWGDEIIQVPNGDACLSAEGEKRLMRGVCSKLLCRVCRK